MRSKLLFALLAGAAGVALAASPPPDAPVIDDGPIKVDVADIDGYLLRVPENRRAEFRASADRLRNAADSLFIARSLAAKARAAGMDKDLAVQRRLQQVQDALLADLYVQQLEKGVTAVNLEQRARELYVADPARFTTPEQMHVQQILVGLNGRTHEEARKRAQDVYREAKAGKEDFLALAARLSDDPDKPKNGGDLGYVFPTRFIGPLAQRITAMKSKGEISEPIESPVGFHILRMVDRKAAEQKKFEDVKNELIAQQREILAKKRTEDALTEIRSSGTATVHNDTIEALAIPGGELLSKAAADAARTSTEPARKP